MAQAPTMVRPRPADEPPSRSEATPGRGFRGDVEGLRAVAVGLVLLYHAGLSLVPGGFVGVDVFFVISGFLITGLLVKELRKTGRISLAGFYARRAKRLLPATAVVLISTAVLVLMFVPKIHWTEIGGDIVASALYVVNWRLANRSVDYLAEDSGASPLQHFWSLAVEEQYYLVWPVLILLATLWVRRRGRPMTGALWLGLAVIGLPSLAWSIYQTAYEPARAFFITTTRMWELAVGAAVAIAASQLARMPRVVAVVLGWAGLAAIAASGLVYSVRTPWPGSAALLPVLGSAAVIAAGTAAGRAGPIMLLGTRPFLWVGALSYSLYLWHWPLIVIATYYWGGLSVQRGLLLAAISVIPAYLTYRLIENPFRHSAALSRSPRLALSIGANATMIGVLAGTMVVLAVPTAAAPAGPSPGAAVLEPRTGSGTGAAKGAPVDKVEWITPDPLQATKDVPELYADGCQVSEASSDPKACVYGNPDGNTTVALVGDSKIAQWLPAFQELAKTNDWKIVTQTKSACPLSTAPITLNGEVYQSCADWNSNLLAALTGPDKPDYVITSQVRSIALKPAGLSGHAAGVDAMVAGMHASWTTLTDAGVKVIVLGDTPQTGMSVYECVSENTDHLTRCTYDRARGVTRSALPTQQAAVAGMPEVKLVDLTRSICPTPKCAPVIGNVLVYRQGSHLTATYIKTLAPKLGEELTVAGLPADGKS